MTNRPRQPSMWPLLACISASVRLTAVHNGMSWVCTQPRECACDRACILSAGFPVVHLPGGGLSILCEPREPLSSGSTQPLPAPLLELPVIDFTRGGLGILCELLVQCLQSTVKRLRPAIAGLAHLHAPRNARTRATQSTQCGGGGVSLLGAEWDAGRWSSAADASGLSGSTS